MNPKCFYQKQWLLSLVMLLCIQYSFADVTDELTMNTFTNSVSTTYYSYTDKTASSDAVYAGNLASGNSAIQLRSSNSNSGIVSTTSGGKLKQVVVTWNNSTSSDRTIDIYGKNTAYSAATDLYSTSTQGTKLGSIVKGTSTTLSIDGDYEYIGIRSSSGALYATKIAITWATTPSCSNSVSLSKGSETKGSVSLGSTSVATCSSTATDRQVTITVTPSTGYNAPATLTWTKSSGTVTATKVSGPTGSGPYTYVYQFAQNDNGAGTFGVTCTAKTTTVSFNQNGGEGGQTTTKTATYGQAMPTPITTPTRYGHTFGGYWTNSNGTGTQYYNADGSSAHNWDITDATKTLYAKWTEKALTNYRTTCCTPLGAITGTISLSKSGEDVTASGWSATSGGNETGYLVKLYNSDKSAVIASGNTGSKATKTYTFSSAGAGTYWVSVTPTYSGAGSYCETGTETFSASSIVVTGNVTVTFKKNGGGGTDNKTQSVAYNTATALTSLSTLGYTAPSCKEFKGWATSEANATAGTIAYADGANITATSATTLWATWKTITYTVTQGTNSGAATFTLSPASSVDCGGTITVTSTPDSDHKGSPTITVSPAGAGTVSGTTITDVSGNITVNISYTAKATYNITWMANGSAYTTGSPTTSVTEGNAISTLPTAPTSCDTEKYTNFVGWYAYEAGSQSDPTDPSDFASDAGDKVTTSTVPTGNVTYYAVFSDGDPDGWSLITSAGDLNEDDEYTLGTKDALSNTSLRMMSTQASNNRTSVLYTDADFETNVRTFQLEAMTSYGDHHYSLKTTDTNPYLWLPSENNYLRSRANTYENNAVFEITINSTSHVATLKPQGQTSFTNKTYTIRFNTSNNVFSCYYTGQADVYIYKKGGVGTGYISTCGENIKIENDGQHLTSGNGIWVQSQNITLTGTNLTDTYSAVTVVITVTSGGTSKWRVKDAATDGQGTTSGVTFANITNADWTKNIAVTYTPSTPSAANVASEEATIQIKAYKYQGNSTTQVVVEKTFKMYGRSLPANFLIAVNDGTLAEGHWYAIPADMIAPYGSSCTSGLGTYKPIPITVNNNENPTKATIAPARAVYQPAARTGNVNTSPQTLSFKSKTLSGSTTYYLYGGGTGGDATNNNTHIQNASFGTSEKEKWFLETSDFGKYSVHLSTTITPNVLGFTTAGGNNRVGQYSADASTTKKDIWFLPFDDSECVYIPAPDVRGVSLTSDNYTIQFPKDRLATAWQISTDGGSSWIALPGETEIACSGGVETPTTVQGVLPMSTYRGQTVKIKVSSPNATCGENIGEFVVPNPVITVNGATPWHLYGITGQAFSDQTQTITLSGLYEGAGAATNVTSSNDNIHAELVAPVTNGDVHVRLTMTAGAATEGNHNTTLTFTSTGAETKTRNVTITMQSLAPQSFTKLGGYFSGDILCTNADLSSSSTYVFQLSQPIYSAAGVVGVIGTVNSSNIYLYDVTTGEKVNGSSMSRSIDGSGYVKFTIHNQIGDMVEGKKYRLEWTNTGQVCKNSSGVPYQDISYTFTYGDCSKPIALQPCPIGTTSFTANWIPSGSNSQSLYVYTMGAGTKICEHTWSEYIAAVGKLNHTSYTNKTNCSRGFYVAQQYTATASYNGSFDATKGQRMSGASNNNKVNGIYTILLPETGNYRVTYTAVTLSNPNTLKVALTDSYGDISSTKFTDDIATTAHTFEHIINVGTANTYKIALLPADGISGSQGSVFISYFKVEKVGARTYVTGFGPKTGIANSITSYNITGLTAGTRYYYTVSNGSESNEVAVTTRSDAPAIDFSPGKAVLQTDVNGTVSTTVSLDGSNITLCELDGIISGTNAAYFSADPSGLVYNQTTGAVSGDLVITYHPTTTGRHTATYTIDGVSLELEGHACPAGFGNLATAATSVTNNSAKANWSTNTTGFLMVAENQRMNTELLINPGFEQDGLGWDGVPESFTPTSGSSHNEIKTALKRSGSNGLYVAYSQGGSFLYIGEGSGLYSGVYGAKQTLPAGTYTISAYVHGVSGSSALGNFASSDYHTMYVGFAVDYPTKNYSTSRKAVGSPTGTRINGQSTWVKVEDSFTLDEPTTGYIFIVNSTTLGANFALDDVSLKCTGIVAGNAFSEYPITSQKTYNLTGLKPSTSYSYYVVNADGCESNIISFTTTASGAAPELEATPQPLVISGPKGNTAKSTVSITAENAYSNILLSVGDACGGRISISPTSLSSTGGLVTVSFTPLEGDAEGDKGSCTISATTLGIAATYNITVNWNVTAGVNVNTPTIEVVTITNSTMDIEHNIEKVSENSEIRIQLDRELTPEEIEENVGDEIFFSKYYEAYMHKKLWAIYNPTNEKISLKGMQVWRSAGGKAGDKSEWNRSDVVYLDSYGAEEGFIGPKEEIIIYASQNSYSCEQERTDMSGWFGYPNSGALSYSGDDALLLVRKVRTGEADYRTPPAESVEWNDKNDHSKGHVALSWRTIVDDDDTEWTMLDIIGARAKNNMPDGTATKKWTWTNCKNSNTREDGDDQGWVGYGYDLTHENLNYYNCSAQNGSNGYLLSTNRCLLIRLYSVKSGNNAVAVNVGDMYTLGKGGVQPEWKGAHVPTNPSSEQDRISCENFSFVGGYDYSNYYNSWTPLNEGGDYLVGPRNPDGSYTVSGLNVPRYWCNKIRIELVEHETVNGVDVDNLRHYQDYKVPIVVDEDAQTNTAKFFGNPNNPSYSGANENPKKGEWSTVCAECDVVVNSNTKLTHVAAGKQQFHNMQLYAGAKLDVADNLTMTLNALQLRADNNNVSYAIINNGKASITVDSIIHVKRIDDAHWYRFSLPYDCDIASIRQLNGKSMGTYDFDGVNDNLGTWVIKYYDGEERQEADDFAGAGSSSTHWKPMPGTGTLEKHKGYIIGLYVTEWAGQHKQVYFPPKNPNATYGYTEGGTDTKTANVYSWAVNKGAGDKMNHGWNFVGLPFISVFNPAHTGLAAGINNSTVMITGKFDDQYADQDNVYVSVPVDDGMKYYEQNPASTQKLEPFLAYFVQVTDPSGSTNETKTITYAKAGRELSLAPRRIGRYDIDDNMHIALDVLFVRDSMNYDKTGVLIAKDYTLGYEIGRDLIKMSRANSQAKIHSIAADNMPMAYNALPFSAADYIPLSMYAPSAGSYEVRISELSDLTEVEAAYLLYNGEQVADLKFDGYTLNAQRAGAIEGYALNIVPRNLIATSVSSSTDDLSVICANGKIELRGVAEGAEVSLYDVLGHKMGTKQATDGTVEFDVWVTGVYQLVVRTDSGIQVMKTIKF